MARDIAFNNNSIPLFRCGHGVKHASENSELCVKVVWATFDNHVNLKLIPCVNKSLFCSLCVRYYSVFI